jgi:hypothetical protein
MSLIEEGGPGSGNFGHAGRPGEIGGSASSGNAAGGKQKDTGWRSDRWGNETRSVGDKTAIIQYHPVLKKIRLHLSKNGTQYVRAARDSGIGQDSHESARKLANQFLAGNGNFVPYTEYLVRLPEFKENEMGFTSSTQIARSAIEVGRAIINESGEIDRDSASRLLDALERDVVSLEEVIKKEGDEVILYSKDGKKVLGRFPFGKGKKYADEKSARAAAHKREGQVQFFKHQGESQQEAIMPGAIILDEAKKAIKSKRKKHSASWHRCWEAVKANGYPSDSAAAICTWSLPMGKNPPNVYESADGDSEEIEEKMVTLSIEDADGALAKEMKKRKIKALKINTETWEVEEVKESAATTEEYYADSPVIPVTIVDEPALSRPRTFADLDAEESAQRAAAEADKRTWQLHRLIDNVMADPSIDNKVGALDRLISEFAARITDEVEQAAAEGMEAVAETFVEEGALDSVIDGVEASAVITALAEQQVELAELDVSGPRAPVVVDLRIISPGPGNARDGHFYPPDTLRRDAHVFEGCDLFITEHDGKQRGEKTKVGKVLNIARFEETGAPIGRSVIYDPDMAEKTRNRAAAKMLETLACSITGPGLVRPGKVDGKPYKIVTEILPGPIVEFVSKAGAGGQAVALVENETGGQATMAEQVVTQQTQPPAVVQPPAQAAPPAQPATAAESAQQAANAQQAASAQPVTTVTTLAEADVKAALDATGLPSTFKRALSSAQYPDKPALDSVIAEALAEVKTLTAAGQTFGQGNTAPQEPTLITEADYHKRVDGIIKKFTGIEISPVKPE